MLNRIEAPAPGVYPNTPAEIYHSWDAMSKTVLEYGRRSMAHLKYAFENPKEDTPSLLIGRATHAAVLEPDVFTSRFVRLPEIDRRTKEGKATYEAIVAKVGAEYLLKPDDYDTCAAMRDSVWGNPEIAVLLGARGDAELSVVWRDPGTGVLCKGRYDRVAWDIGGGTIIDLKTVRSAEEHDMERAIYEFGWHRQGGIYRAAADALGLSIKHYAIVAVEKEPPYCSRAFRVTDEALDAGWKQAQIVLEQVAEAQRTNVWPGYPSGIKDVALPAWAWDRIAQEVAA